MGGFILETEGLRETHQASMTVLIYLTRVTLVLPLKKIHGREGVGKRERERKEDPLQGELGAALFHRE